MYRYVMNVLQTLTPACTTSSTHGCDGATSLTTSWCHTGALYMPHVGLHEYVSLIHKQKIRPGKGNKIYKEED